MIGLRTEYSFRKAYGSLDKVLENVDEPFAAMCDVNSTWGHIRWSEACKAAGKKPLFGVELSVVEDADLREKQPTGSVLLLAMNEDGLREMYELVSEATELFYYIPRLDWKRIEPSENLVVIARTEQYVHWGQIHLGAFLGLSPNSLPPLVKKGQNEGFSFVAVSDNFYPSPEDFEAWEVAMGKDRDDRVGINQIPHRGLLQEAWGEDLGKSALDLASRLGEQASEIVFEKAEMAIPPKPKTLLEMCEEGAAKRGIDLNDPVYRERLDMELSLIKEKNYEDYFYLVQDVVVFAKQHMLVGPARGSSCGSLVCYLIEITDIDPIPYGLLFERFIDINRMDLPDIDIDFADDKRDMVFDYLRDKYGADCVSRLGTVSYFKSKAAITDTAKILRVPAWDTEDLKGSIIERSSGDSRAMFCLEDTFDTKTGKDFLDKYPEMKIAAKIEGAARHTGVHAAAILVTNKPISRYAPIDQRTGAAMLDKKDAEKVDLLKIDALGLRTLSVVQDTIDQVGISREKLKDWRLDDEAAFEILNKSKFWGVFQFEGYALQNIVKQMPITEFEDVVSITALARPGPLASGGAAEFVKRKKGLAKVEYLHPLCEEVTKVTLGVVVYQEQVMKIAREIGKMSWKDVAFLRRIISKSRGKEEFNKFWEKFWVGAKENGLTEEEARHIWDHINTMGAWAFNRSHAVAYGMMSYWCLVLKAHYPLQFAAASLRNAKDETQCIKILRELVSEGHEYLPYHPKKSEVSWSVQDNKLVGGLISIKGIGPKLAADILRRREEGEPLTKRQSNLLEEGTTPWDTVFEGKDRWSHIYDNPEQYNITSKITPIESITEETDGTFVFIAKITAKNIRDHNELIKVERRGGKLYTGQTKFLNLTIEDDTSNILAIVASKDYLKMGTVLLDEGRIGDWYVWKGTVNKGFRGLKIQRIKRLTGNSEFFSK